MYVIKRGKEYVARPGSQHSYTKNLEKAQVFKTKDDAEKSRCGNEYIIRIDAVLHY